jgi:hypothetical protein
VTYIEIPALKKGDMAMSFSNPDPKKFDFSKSGTLTSLLIVNYKMYAMTILADSEYLKGNYNKLKDNTYQKMEKDFSGSVFFSLMDGTFVNGWRYQNGTITRQYSPYTSNHNVILTTGRLKVDVAGIPPGCGAIITVTLWEDCAYLGSDVNFQNPFDCHYYTTTDVVADCPVSAPSGGSSGGSGGTAPPPPPCIPPNLVPPTPTAPPTTPSGTPAEASTRSKLVINVALPPPGGGTPAPTPQPQPCNTTNNPVTPVPATITNKVKNPCLHGLVEATISSGVTNQINSLIQNVFGGSTTMNLTFIDVNTLPIFADGYTNNNGGIISGKLNVEIQLDANHLPSFSQEYIARVIMHEALHAYLDANGMVDALQHEDMIINYVTKMAAALQQIFPHLGVVDAKNLALGGLQLTTTFQNTIENDMGLSGTFAATNIAYSQGSLGTRCK